jgi:hypothetical protein
VIDKDSIVFSEINEIGALFDQHYHLPFMVNKIEVDGKEYIGTVMTLRVSDGGKTILSGEFFPYLEMDYFESFHIYPNKYKFIDSIDVIAPQNMAVKKMAVIKTTLDKVNIYDIGLIKRKMPEVLKAYKEAILEFGSFHPEYNTETAIFLTEECIEMCNDFKIHEDNVENRIERVLNDIRKNLLEAGRHLFFRE